MKFYLSAILWWLLFAVIASANGAIGKFMIEPLAGPYGNHLYKTAVFVTVLIGLIGVFVRRAMRNGERGLWRIGVFWLGLTVAFEFLAGHYLFGNSWEALFADYRIWKGRLWSLVLAAILIAPLWWEKRINKQTNR